MKRVFKSLRARLVALIVAAMLPILVITWYGGLKIYRHAIGDVYWEAKSLVQEISLEQDKHINAAQYALMALAANPMVVERRPGFCSIFDDVLVQQEMFANVGMTDLEGNSLCRSIRMTRDNSFKDQLWFQRIREGHEEIVVGDYHSGVLVDEPVVIVAKPIKGRQGEHLAYLFVSVDLSWFNRSNLGSRLPEGTELFFHDHDGVILHSDPQPEVWRDRPIAAAIQRVGEADRETGVVEAYGGDGTLRLFSFARLRSSLASENAFVAVGIPASNALVPVRRAGGLMLLAIVGVFGGMLVFAWLGARRLVIAPVRRMVRHANAYAAGDLTQRSGVAEGTELSELAHALDEMAAKMAERDRVLAQHLQAFNEHAIVSAADTAGRIVYANDKFCEISQYSREEIIGKTHALINSGFHPPEVFVDLWNTISRGGIWHGNIRNRRKDGSHYWVASTIVPFFDRDGRLERYFSIRTDITRALEIDAALQKSEAHFRLLAKNALDVISLHDPDGRFVYVSPSLERVLGHEPSAMIGLEWDAMVHPDDMGRVRETLRAPVSRGEPGECAYVRLRHRNGDYIWADISAAPTRDEAGHILNIQASARDVTTRKRMEDELRLHDRALADSGTGIVIFRCGDLAIEYANTAFLEIAELAEAGITGQVWPVLAQAVKSAGGWRFLHDAITLGAERHAVVEGRSQRDRTVWCDIFISPVHSEVGEVTHFVAAINDVTDQISMEDELVRAKETAEQASQAKSKFLSHVSHELRTPLNTIVGFAQLLESDPQAPLNDEQQDNIKRILAAGWLLRELIDDVLDLSRIETGRLELKPEQADVSDLIRECLEQIAPHAAAQGLELVNLSAECVRQTVAVDVNRFRQVLLNLLSNAVKYNREGGRVTVSCHLLENGRLRIAVTDSGIGISQARRNELFQYFSRLGAEESSIPGIGVGLALCRHLVDLMGGVITVDSVEGEGSSFTIELPAARREAETTRLRDVSDAGVPGGMNQ